MINSFKCKGLQAKFVWQILVASNIGVNHSKSNDFVIHYAESLKDGIHVRRNHLCCVS